MAAALAFRFQPALSKVQSRKIKAGYICFVQHFGAISAL
jgi:hypothetical protein